MKPTIRPIALADLDIYRKQITSDRAYHQLNGPYLGCPTEEEQDQKVTAIKKLLIAGDSDALNFQIIVNETEEAILGEVSHYWKDERTDWLEVGILIFDECNWSKSIGTKILPIWISHVMKIKPRLARIGLTTWSGNPGMMKLASKIGLEQEACYRKARIFEGKHYDSVSYGIL